MSVCGYGTMRGDAACENAGRVAEEREYFRRTVAEVLTINETGPVGLRFSPSGLVHFIGVSLIVWENVVTRGKNKDAGSQRAGMPRFVDVRLDATQREEFTSWLPSVGDVTQLLVWFVDSGYRVGVAWAGEQQAYFVSLTGRSTGTSNDGCCMTSFAGDLTSAIALAYYKHTEVCGGVWGVGSEPEKAAFG